MMLFNKPLFWTNKNPNIISLILWPISLLIVFVSTIKKLGKQEKFNIPIICVGNIYLGGTGKTPISIEVYKMLQSLGKSPGFVKKYYPYLKDEIQILKSFGDVFDSKVRAISIKNLEKNGNDIAVLDDGFQDFSIHKDFNILCFDGSEWIGNGMTIPSGPLREPLKALKRANCIFIKGDKNTIIEDKIRSINPKVEIYYFFFKLKEKEKFIGKKLVAFSGIGNNKNFFNILTKNKLEVKKTFSYPDHYNFKDKNLEKILLEAANLNALVVTTEKDYNRINNKFKSKIFPIKVNTHIREKEKFLEDLKKI
ncbi:MAG: tetraacyldisaccharide 4'-kinase [Candidatus Pelagibacter sp. TMED118]|nr:MAG: tetraacyldisaccharide 4'-kinase [Candidatus Pelagibacter sp. TMED118]|tara:strand:- start:918 stop:1844 length:927 start_codon:yes stop_codon:yes gene_type:complete